MRRQREIEENARNRNDGAASNVDYFSLQGIQTIAGEIGQKATETVGILSQRATETASALQEEEGRQQLKESVYSGLSTAKDGVQSGAYVALEKSTRAVNYAGTATMETMDWTAENMKKSYSSVYEASYNTGAALRDKIDETGITDRASEAA